MKRSMKSKGYTLIEIMVSTVIIIVLFGLAIQITGEVLNAWSRTSGKLSASSEARVAMDVIANDLEGIVVRNDGHEWFRAENDILKEPAKSKSVALRFFSVIKNKPTDSKGITIPGEISAVAYNVHYVNPVDGSNRGEKAFVLYRLEVDPETTYRDLLDLSSRERLPNKKSPNWGEGNLVKGMNGDNYLASNIVGFEIDFYLEDDGNRSTPRLYFNQHKKNPRRSVIYGGREATIGPQAKLEHYQRALAYADIKLTVLSDEGAEIMRNVAQRPETPADVIRLHSEKFIRRVHFPVKPF